MTDASDRDRSFHAEALPQMPAVYRFALRLAQDEEAAGDLTQETFLRAYQHWDKYTPGTRVKSWLFTICRNGFFRSEDRRKRHDEILAAEAEADPRAVSREAVVFMESVERDPESTYWNAVVDEEILRAIDGLPEDFREVVVLSDMEDLSYEEISQTLRIPVGTVKSRLFRGRRILQRALYDYAVSTGVVAPRSESRVDPERRGLS